MASQSEMEEPSDTLGQMGATYSNTDLVIRARFDFAPLVAELNRFGLDQIGAAVASGGVWRVTFEADTVHTHPSQAIDRMLDVVEGLDAEHRLIWDECIDRRFDLGFEGCDESFYSRWEIGASRLRRLASVNASFIITVYRSPEKYVTHLA